VRNRRPVFALIVANAVSLVGSSLTGIAVPWFVLETTGSAGKAGLTGAFAFLPAFFAGIFGGAVVDRIGARHSAMVADLVSGTAILMVPVLYHTVGLQFWQLLILVMIGSLLDIPGLTARRALLPELATLGDVRLERVNAMLEGNWQLSILLGPPIAGVLIGFMGAANVLWIDAASSLISFTALLLLIPANIHERARAASQGYLRDLRAGIQFLWRDQVLRWISIMLAISNAFGAPVFSLIMVVYIKGRFDDPRYLGVMLSASGIGLMIGNAFYGWRGFRLPRRWVVTMFLITYTLVIWPFAFTFPFPVLLVLVALSGLFDGPVNPLLVTVRLERIPIELRGRVFAATSAMAQAFPAFTIPLAGWAIEGVGLTTTVLIIAVGAQVAGLLLTVLPAWAHLDDTAPQTAEGAVAA
jgi:MFS family permease